MSDVPVTCLLNRSEYRALSSNVDYLGVFRPGAGNPKTLILNPFALQDKDEPVMSVVLSNTDSILLAVPMLGLLFVGYFRLDALFSKPRKRKNFHAHPLASLDKNGAPVCLDPDEALKFQGKQAPVRRHRVVR